MPSHPPCPHCGSTAGPDHPCPGPLLGKVLDNRYQIESVLGHGGMGMVFLATQTNMKRQVAVKTLHPSLASSPQFFERFRREAETASQLNHPNIITVFDFGRSQDGTYYFVMELVNGQSLKQIVKGSGPLTLRRAVGIIEQCARGLAHAHQMGVVHRDIKPHNILISTVDGAEFVKILDFGLVKALENEEEEQLTSTGQVLGTPQYMPPEQAGGEGVDARSDLYSLGGVFYYTLTGSSPWGANTVRKALTAALTQQLQPVSSKREGAPVPKGIEELLRKALDKEKENRHQSADELLDALHTALRGVPADVLDAVPTGGGNANKETGSGSESRGRGSPSSRARSSAPSASARGRPSSVLVSPDLAITHPRARAAVPEAAGRDEGPSTAKKLALLAIPVVLFVAGGGVMVAMRKDASAAQATPQTVTTQVISVDPPRSARATDVLVKLTSTPSGASVFQGDAYFGATPLDLKLSREMHALSFKLEGYTVATRNLDLAKLEDDRSTVDVALEPLAAKSTPPPAGGKGKKGKGNGQGGSDSPIPVFE
ncbi:MAG TPA: serine/threonine-protein kinase [Myxococcales bacterium]|jgi:serine/threonine-protein kinase|nr:serine/threonine-protein kinase [Myxococcales bacterium]